MSAYVVRVPAMELHFYINLLLVGLEPLFSDSSAQERWPDIHEETHVVPESFLHTILLLTVPDSIIVTRCHTGRQSRDDFSLLSIYC